MLSGRLKMGLCAFILRNGLCWIPRNRSKWVLGASNSFRDNPKYLYYWIIENHKEIRPIWITHNKKDNIYLNELGIESYFWRSIRGLYHALTAKVFISDHQIRDVNLYFSGGAYYVNLWHGVGIKKVRWQAPDFYIWKYHLKDESDMKNSFRFKMLTYSELFVKPDFLLAPSVAQAQMFYAPMLNVEIENCVLGIPPRSRLLLEGKESAIHFIKKNEPKETLQLVNMLSSYDKVYIYMPTWRSHKNDFVKEANIDWMELDKALKKNNALLLLRLHMFTEMDLSCIDKYDNITEYPNKSDIYTVLPFTDCLITDYSSIYTDFLTMNKEIILFVYDYDRFVKESHTLEDYEKYYLGKRVYDFNQLVEVIYKNQDCHLSKDDYNYSMRYFWDNNQHKIDIVEEIKKRLD